MDETDLEKYGPYIGKWDNSKRQLGQHGKGGTKGLFMVCSSKTP